MIKHPSSRRTASQKNTACSKHLQQLPAATALLPPCSKAAVLQPDKPPASDLEACDSSNPLHNHGVTGRMFTFSTSCFTVRVWTESDILSPALVEIPDNWWGITGYLWSSPADHLDQDPDRGPGFSQHLIPFDPVSHCGFSESDGDKDTWWLPTMLFKSTTITVLHEWLVIFRSFDNQNTKNYHNNNNKTALLL